MRKSFAVWFAGLWVLLASGAVQAAVCTSTGNGTWTGTAGNASTLWSCGHVPLTTDTVVIAHAITLNSSNYTVAGLTVNSGATLVDNGKDLTVSGNVVIDGTYDGSGNNGTLTMTGNGSTLSGTGTIKDIKRIAIDANVTIPAGSNLNLTLQSEIRVGNNNPATLTIDGTITGTGQANGNRIIRVDNNNAASVVVNGTINAPNSFVEIQQGGVVTNNGTVTLQYLDGNGDNNTTWTQGANSTLTLSQPTQGWKGTFNASATGNTVNFNGTATPFNPATYFNINVSAASCPHPAGITVTGTSSCGGAGGGGGGGGGACGTLPTALTSGTTLGFSQSGFSLNTNGGGGATNVVNTTVTPNTTVAATGTLNTLGVSAAPTQAVTATLPPLSPATFPAITGVNGALTNPATAVAPGSYTTITKNNAGTIVFSGGTTPTYIRKLISTVTTATLQFAPGDYYIDSLTVRGNLTISPAGLVRLFIGTQQTGAYGAAATTGGNNNNGFQTNSQINTGGDPANLQLLLYPLVTYFEFNNGTQFTGIMYQPVVDANAPRPNWGLAPGQFDLHTGVSITGSLYTPGVIETWGGNTFNYTPQVAAAISSFGTCPSSGVDHFLISHPGNGLTCTSQAVEVSACANAACTSFVGGKTVTLQPGGASVTTSATGPVASTVSQTTAGAATLSLTSTTTTNSGTQCQNTSTGAAASIAACTNAMNFSTAGYVVTVPDHVSGNTVSATIEAKQAGTNNKCVPAYSGVNHSVDLGIAYVNPGSGTLPATVTTNTAVPVTGTVGTTSSAYSLAFDVNGMATLALTYPDVGQLTLNASGTAPNGATMASSGGTFIASPASFSITAVTAGPIKAGAAFSATISALNSAGNVTPNFGKEAAPEGVTLSSILAMGAGTWQNPALVNRVIAGGTFTNGVATVNNLSWSEVGDITLKADLTSASYLGTGNTATGATTVSTKFIPDHYDTWIKQAGVAPAIVPMACVGSCPANAYGASGMVYSGQPFTVQVIARNTNGCTMPPVAPFNPATDSCVTKNYQGTTYAQDVTLSGVGGAGSLSNPLLSASSFVAGVGTTSAVPAYTFAAPATAPTNITIRAVGSGVSSAVTSSGATESGLNVVSGRIKISNAYGSEKLPLKVNALTQYCAAVAAGSCTWVKSATDSATAITLAATYNVLDKNGATTGTTTPSPTGLATFASGVRDIVLSKPTAGAGSVQLAPTAPSYLPLLPGTATFGIYKGANEFIYLRESY